MAIYDKNYHAAILLLKKALQFIWFIKDIEKEIEIYDLIGKAYYYFG